MSATIETVECETQVSLAQRQAWDVRDMVLDCTCLGEWTRQEAERMAQAVYENLGRSLTALQDIADGNMTDQEAKELAKKTLSQIK